MNKSAQIKFAKAINEATDHVYIDTFVKRASARGIPVNTEEDLAILLKTAAALRAVSEAIAPAVKEANTRRLRTAMESLLAVEL